MSRPNPRITVFSAILLGTVLLGLGHNAWSHTRWNPQGLVQPRTNNDDIKRGPCGDPRGSSAVVLPAGAEVTLEFESTIYHRGHFRIAFSPVGDQDFDDYVLADNIPDFAGQRYRSHTVTLPDMECDACTLQLIQVMLDRNPPTNYFSCADIQLVRSSAAPEPVSALLATPGDGQLQLMWQNPASLTGVLVVESSAPLQAKPQQGQAYNPAQTLGEGTVVANGLRQDLLLSPRTPGETYHYSLFSYDAHYQYSDAVSTQVTLAQMANVAPTISLRAEQNQRTLDSTLDPGAGPVIVQATVNDANSGDSHTLVWQVSDTRIQVLEQNPTQLHFDPADLPPGTYTISAQVTDSGEPPLSAEAHLQFTVSGRRAGSWPAGWLAILLGTLWAVRRPFTTVEQHRRHR